VAEIYTKSIDKESVIVMHSKVVSGSQAGELVRFQTAVLEFESVLHGASVARLAELVAPDGRREKLFAEIGRVVSTHYERYFLPRVEGTSFQEAVQALIRNGLMTQFAQGTEEYLALRSLAIQRNKLVRAIVKHLIQTGSPHLGLDGLERIEYRTFMDILSLTDGWLVAFTERLHDVPTSSENEWTVFRLVGGSPTEITFAEAFPQVHQIGTLYAQMADHIAALGDGVDSDLRARKVAYYRACAALYLCTDPSQTKALLLEADKRFAAQGGSVVTLHAMETGYSHDRTRRAPEAQIAVLLSQDPINADRMADIEDLRAKMIVTFQRDLLLAKGLGDRVRETVERFRDYRPGCYQIMGGGTTTVFRYAGQSVPNEAEAVLEAGRYIFLNPETTAQRFERYRDHVRRFFGAAVTDSLLSQLTFERRLRKSLSGHEIGHAFAKVEKIHDRIDRDSLSLAEEWKATAVMLVERFVRWEEDMDDDLEALRWRLVDEVLEHFRNCERRGQDAAKAYIIGDRMNIALMEQLGILRNTAGSKTDWEFNFDSAKVVQFYRETRRRLYELAEVYERGTTEAVHSFIRRYDIDSRFDSAVVEWYHL